MDAQQYRADVKRKPVAEPHVFGLHCYGQSIWYALVFAAPGVLQGGHDAVALLEGARSGGSGGILGGIFGGRKQETRCRPAAARASHVPSPQQL